MDRQFVFIIVLVLAGAFFFERLSSSQNMASPLMTGPQLERGPTALIIQPRFVGPSVSYFDYLNGDGNLNFLRCSNTLCTFRNIVTVDTGGIVVNSTGTYPINVGSYSSLAKDTSGLPIISYLDTSNYELEFLHCGDTLCNSGNSLTTLDTVTPPGSVYIHLSSTSVALGSDNLPVISYTTLSSFSGLLELDVVHCGNLDCEIGNTISTVDYSNNGALGSIGFSSLAIAPDGYPIISYQDSPNLRIAKCHNTDCSVASNVAVDSVVGYWTSITIGADNLPIISYIDGVNWDLKVAHCGTLDCTSGNTITTVDSLGFIGYWTSITIGADNLPIISYHDSTNKDLKVAHCGTLDCTSGNTITTVDSLGDVGTYSSITKGTGAGSYPFISYYDATNGDLKVVSCGTLDCTSGNTITTVDSLGYVGSYTSAE